MSKNRLEIDIPQNSIVDIRWVPFKIHVQREQREQMVITSETVVLEENLQINFRPNEIRITGKSMWAKWVAGIRELRKTKEGKNYFTYFKKLWRINEEEEEGEEQEIEIVLPETVTLKTRKTKKTTS